MSCRKRVRYKDDEKGHILDLYCTNAKDGHAGFHTMKAMTPKMMKELKYVEILWRMRDATEG